jgi:hypothetical protein
MIFTSAETVSTNSNNNSSSSSSNNDTSSSTITDMYQPIRIRVVLSEQSVADGIAGGGGLTTWQRSILFQEILSPALLAWSSALRVDPVVGNLTVDAYQLLDGATCGPGGTSGHPSVPVPPSHMTFGVPDTDVLVYLSLGYNYDATSPESSTSSTGNNASSSSSSPSTPSTNMPTPMPSTLADAQALDQWFVPPSDSNNSSGSSSDAPGVVEFYNATNDPFESDETTFHNHNTSAAAAAACTGEYLASATYCSTDQYDRPTAAMLHLCIDEGFFWENSTSRNIITVMHELGHALGFNALSLAHFRWPNGTPMTPRNAEGDVIDERVECTGPLGRRGRQRATVALPSPETLQFRTVRGGIRVAEVVTPSVQQTARNHFSCQDLPGAELESGGGAVYGNNHSFDPYSSSCLGDHW